MTISRREFLKQTAMLAAGSAGLPSLFSKAIQKAYSIDPDPGSTYMDAEHVVFLMQENRSFDHCFGSLRGVRGFSDPRAINLPDGNPVWFQSNEKGETYAPFRLNLEESKATWMDGLPHGWPSQVAARNGGRYDKWLEAKKSGNEEYADMPLTLGYYTRRDIPFYYALADAFTVCDQNFCSSLTGTSPNRLYFWSGTVREEQHQRSKPHLFNGDIDYKDLQWQTFPERLQKHGIDWRVYQNELSIPVGLKGKQPEWLANFTDNDLEYFAQYKIRLHKQHLQYVQKKTAELKKKIKKLERENTPNKKIDDVKKKLSDLLEYRKKWNQERYERLSDFEKSIHQRAFTTNAGNPDYHKLERLTYDDNGTQREINIPKGDILKNFRDDVHTGNLPTVSWLVAPQNFSDHPSAPWYGAWYVSEVMNILTQNPDIWKKTIFVVTYDENDGYFDHVPPFVAPNPSDLSSGSVSKSIQNEVDYAADEQFDSPIGLGYRVPKLVISPWSRGGWVNSEVLDHTSDLQFLEHFLSHKTGQDISEPTISDWRRAVCGDMSSVFRPYNGEEIEKPKYLDRKQFIQQINNAKYKELPKGYRAYSDDEVASLAQKSNSLKGHQESGQRPSCALPYQLRVDENVYEGILELQMKASDEVFGDAAAGAPFAVYAPSGYQIDSKAEYEKMCSWNFAAKAGEQVEGAWQMRNFADDVYHLELHGPNGFYRAYKGSHDDPAINIFFEYERSSADSKQLTGHVRLSLSNEMDQKQKVIVSDMGYDIGKKQIIIPARKERIFPVTLSESSGWYDLRVQVDAYPDFERRYAGRVETGDPSYSDPQMA